MLRNGLRTVFSLDNAVMSRLPASSVNVESAWSVVRARLRMQPSSLRPVPLPKIAAYALDSRHRPVLPINGKMPVIDPTVYIATNATVSGNVQIATGSAVWYGSIVRGDNNSISIGTESHIQDRSVVSSVKSTDSGLPGSVSIGNNVVVGYGSVLTGCRIDDNCHIGSWKVLTWRRTRASLLDPLWSRERRFLLGRWFFFSIVMRSIGLEIPRSL